MSEAQAEAVAAEGQEPAGGVEGSNLEGSTGLGVTPSEPQMAADWRDSIPADIRNSLDVESLEDLAKGYVNAQSMIGNSIRIPGKDAGEADWSKFYEKFSDVPGLARYNPDDLSSLYEAAGRPKDAADYKLDAPEEFLQAAHEAGLNRSQVEAMLNHQNAVDAAHSDMDTQQVESDINSLKQEWGMAFETKLQEGQRAVQFLEQSIPGLAAALDATGAGNNPAVIKLMQTLGANLQESDAFGVSREASNQLTPYEARMQIEEILNNPQHPYHEGNEAATERFLELHKFAHPAE